MRAPDLKQQFEQQGVEVVGSKPEEFRKLVVANIKRFAELVKLAGVEPE